MMKIQRTSMLFLAIWIWLCLMAPSIAASPDHTVSMGESIQAAIDAAKPGETVYVEAGTFQECIEMRDKVSLVSKAPGETVISAGGKGPVVLACGVGATTTLEGFVLTDGDFYRGGGIHLDDSSLWVSKCTITANQASIGGGIYIHRGAPVFIDCMITKNSSSQGAGVYASNSSVQFSRCILSNNKARRQGGAIDNYRSTLAMDNCLVYRNDAPSAGFLVNEQNAEASLTFCTISGNSSKNSGILNQDSQISVKTSILWENGKKEITNRGRSSVQTEYSNIFNSPKAENNISLDPLFVDPSAGDFHLKTDSPCVDAGSTLEQASLDLDGQNREADGNHDQIAFTDMGAYEVQKASIKITQGNVKEGQWAVLTVSVSECLARGAFQTDVDWGDGTNEQIRKPAGTQVFTIRHLYRDNMKGNAAGVYSVSVTANGLAGLTAAAQTYVAVSNVIPSISFNSRRLDVRVNYIIDGSFTDPGQDTWTGQVDYGDGNGFESLLIKPDRVFRLAHQYSRVGDYILKLKIEDDDGGVGVTEAMMYVREAAVEAEPTPPPAPVVNSVTVNPATANVVKGNTQAFSAIVMGTNNPAQTVTWSVSGGISGTSIDNTGLLTVAADETTNTLVVTATSTADNTKSGAAVVTVESPSPPVVPTLIGVKRTNYSVVTLIFDQPMQDPAGHEAAFSANIGSGYKNFIITRSESNHCRIHMDFRGWSDESVPVMTVGGHVSYTPGTYASEAGMSLEGFTDVSITSTEVPVLISAETNNTGDSVIITFDRAMTILPNQKDSFNVWIGETPYNVNEVQTVDGEPTRMKLVLSQSITAGQTAKLNVHGPVRSVNEEYGSIFGEYSITNNVQ